jgi:hypothetical protein
MSDFVQQCRREWERLGVPDPVANEMAADLAADLAEAEAEGVSAEEVLGRSAFDPRSFATSWAAERGVIPSVRHQKSASRKPFILAALATLTVIGVIGGALIALQVHSESVAVAPQPGVPLAPPPPPGGFVLHGGPFAADALAWILLLAVAILAVIVVRWLWSRWARSRPPTAPAR